MLDEGLEVAPEEPSHAAYKVRAMISQLLNHKANERSVPQMWKQKFRGRPADKAKHQHLATLLLEGNTLQSVAEQCDVSLSTVKRVKAKLNQFDEEGSLRRRGDGEKS